MSRELDRKLGRYFEGYIVSKINSGKGLNRTFSNRRKDAAGSHKVGPATPVVAQPVAGRTKSARRRHIDPTTCEREYSAEEREFMTALENYKRASGRMFPTCSEVLEVVRSLGYRRLPAE